MAKWLRQLRYMEKIVGSSPTLTTILYYVGACTKAGEAPLQGDWEDSISSVYTKNFNMGLSPSLAQGNAFATHHFVGSNPTSSTK